MSRCTAIAVLSMALVLSSAGCRKKQAGEANEAAGAPLREQAGEALDAATAYMAREKDKLIQAAGEQLDTLEDRFRGWLDEAGIEDEQARQRLDELGQDFRRALARGRDTVEEAKNVGTEAWTQAKPGLTAAVEDVRKAYNAFAGYIKARAVQKQATDAEPVVEE